jgi:hypothetical protein
MKTLPTFYKKWVSEYSIYKFISAQWFKLKFPSTQCLVTAYASPVSIDR